MAKDAKKDKRGEITYDVEEVYGYLADGKKVYAKVSWNGNPGKDELRRCWIDEKTGELKLGKGIDLSEDEVKELMKMIDKKPKPVDFNAIFDSTAGISDKRRSGLTTVDGFVVLRKRDGTTVGH